jgi:hypothetical protein
MGPDGLVLVHKRLDGRRSFGRRVRDLGAVPDIGDLATDDHRVRGAVFLHRGAISATRASLCVRALRA